MSLSDRRLHLAIASLLFLFLTAISPIFPGFEGDMESWKFWAVFIRKHGLSNAYGSGTNYPPLYQYVVWAFARIAGSIEAIRNHIGYLRVFTLAAEYWGLWIVYRWIDRRIDYVFLLLCSLLNVAYVYNTLIFGQVDAIFAALALAALYYLDRDRRILSAVFMVLALNMKLQAIIFIPLWGLLLIASLHRNRRWNELLWIVLTIVFVQTLLVLPFYFGKDGLTPVWNAVAGLVDTCQYTSMNAFNMWFWIDAGTEISMDDVRTAIGLTYYQIGLLSFSLALLITLLPVLRHTVLTLIRPGTPTLSRETIWLSAALVTLVFFFFNTRMHERYSHAAFIFITAYAFYHRRFGLYALFSLAYLLNLDIVLRGLKLGCYDLWIFDPQFVAALFAICILWTGILLYRESWRRMQKSQAVTT